MPTLVAVSVAPRKAWTYRSPLGKEQGADAPAEGQPAEPRTATRSEGSPTFNMSRTVDSRPTSNSRITTPSRARMSTV